MSAEAPYNTNEELVAMKQDIADRKFRIQLIGLLVSGAMAAVAIAALVLMPGVAAAGASAGMAKLFITGGMALGSAITSMVTLKEVEKLKIDEEYLQSYMQGKNHWGKGYREEVAEYGYGGPQLPVMQGPPMKGTPMRGGRPSF